MISSGNPKSEHCAHARARARVCVLWDKPPPNNRSPLPSQAPSSHLIRSFLSSRPRRVSARPDLGAFLRVSLPVGVSPTPNPSQCAPRPRCAASPQSAEPAYSLSQSACDPLAARHLRVRAQTLPGASAVWGVGEGRSDTLGAVIRRSRCAAPSQCKAPRRPQRWQGQDPSAGGRGTPAAEQRRRGGPHAPQRRHAGP